MADVKWIKIVTDIFENRKIRQIEKMPEGDSIIVVWFKILCLAGSVNERGFLSLTKEIPYTEDMLAVQFNKPLQTVRLALSTFKAFGMIEIIDDVLCISSWQKYQNTDKLEQIREQNRLRQAKYRAKNKKNIDRNATVTQHITQHNAEVTHTDIDIEKDIEIDSRGGKTTGKQSNNTVKDTVIPVLTPLSPPTPLDLSDPVFEITDIFPELIIDTVYAFDEDGYKLLRKKYDESDFARQTISSLSMLHKHAQALMSDKWRDYKKTASSSKNQTKAKTDYIQHEYNSNDLQGLYVNLDEIDASEDL